MHNKLDGFLGQNRVFCPKLAKNSRSLASSCIAVSHTSMHSASVAVTRCQSGGGGSLSRIPNINSTFFPFCTAPSSSLKLIAPELVQRLQLLIPRVPWQVHNHRSVVQMVIRFDYNLEKFITWKGRIHLNICVPFQMQKE